MKFNELKNIVPLKYNSFYSVQAAKTKPKNKIKNLPMIKTFSRNINNDLDKIKYTKTQENYSLKNDMYTDFINNTTEINGTRGKMSQNNYFRLTKYIKNKYGKNMIKIKKNFSPNNNFKEIKLNVNKTEYNSFNKKYFRIDAMKLEKSKREANLIENKNKLTIDDIYNIQKEEFKNKINSVEKRVLFINNYANFIYYQTFPKSIGKNYFFNESVPNFFNHLIIKNLKKSFNLPRKNKQNLIIKENSFIEMIIENVTHKVEYQNQKNERITIGSVKNLLYEELDIISKQLNLKFNQDISKDSKENKINKSTSTDELKNSELINKTYDKFSYVTAKTEKEMYVEEKIKKRIEKRLYELNEKYGFVNDSDNVLMHDRFNSEDKFNSEKSYQIETEEDFQIKSKRKKRLEDDDDDEENNYLGNFIWSMSNEINNIEDYKQRNIELQKEYFFQNPKIRNIFGDHLFIKNNDNNNKTEKIREFIYKNFSGKKNIDFNDIQKNIDLLYNELKSKKELGEKKKLKDTNLQNVKERRKNDEKNVTIKENINELKNEKEKDKKTRRGFRLSTNMKLENILSLLNDNQQYDQLVNGFGGYYGSHGEKKILQQMKDSIENKDNINNIYNEIKKDIIKNNKRESLISNRRQTTRSSNVKQFLLKRAVTKNYNINSIKDNIVVPSLNLKDINNDDDNIDYEDDDKIIIEETEDKKKKNKKNKKNKNDKSKESNEEKDNKENVYDKNNISQNNNIEILEENSFKKESKSIYKNALKEQKKEVTRKNKKTIKTDKKNKNKYFKEDNNINENNKKSKKFGLKHSSSNINLNEFEKDFILKTNYLSDLNEKDREEILKYLQELEELTEKEIQMSSNIYFKTKINNLHYQIENLIISILKKIKKEVVVKLKKSEYFKKLKTKDFLDKQKEILEIKEEEEEENKQKPKRVSKKRNKRDSFYFDPELEIIFERERKRSRSFNIKLLTVYPKLFHNLLYEFIKEKEKKSRAHTPKKHILEDEWEKYFMKKNQNVSKKTEIKINKFIKRKKKF